MRERAAAAIVASGLLYRLLSAALHRPRLLRAASALLRWWGRRYPSSKNVASHCAVAEILKRPASFSSGAHRPNLVAGDFVIGMDPGPSHDGDRRLVESVLPEPARAGRAAAAESRARLAALGALPDRDDWPPDAAAPGDRPATPTATRSGGDATGTPLAQGHSRPAGVFDLIDDYMVWVAWRAIGRAFIGQADAIAGGGDEADREHARRFFLELRYLGAHLMVGAVAPAAIQARAQASACALNRRIDGELLAIERSWRARMPRAPHAGGGNPASRRPLPGGGVPAASPTRQAIRRNAVGINWVAHPATVQAGALLLQELFARPSLLQALARAAQQLGAQAWTDAAFRDELKLHVLELLRFRPVFPILTRDAPRETLFEPRPGRFGRARAGAGLRVFAIGAMFDRTAIAEPHLYLPDRQLADADDRYLHFGMGDRACPAKHHVAEILASALAGLLLLPGLRYADRGRARIRYDGPVITRLRLAYGP
jgi:hypothetical protein